LCTIADQRVKCGHVAWIFGKASGEALFPKEAQAAGHRKRRYHRDNGIGRVGFDHFKEVLDPLSHFNVSHVLSNGRSID
jgi:hypothetical protein